jgi:nitrogen fixation NifU-like protein
MAPPASNSHFSPTPPQPEEFRELILDHSRHPRHFGTLEHPDRTGFDQNPICGDRYRVFLVLTDGRLEAIRFTGTGCAVSMASASMMSDVVEHMRVTEVHSLMERVLELLDGVASHTLVELPGDLPALAVVRQNRIRIKCARLPWNALVAALEDDPS